jgi:hypothetical protein
MSRYDNIFEQTTLFTPSVVRKMSSKNLGISSIVAADLSGSNIQSTASFRYDSPWRPGLKNTQQIPVDWSNFANHTFFNSAESKTNFAFKKIINNYPFDGDRKDLEVFFDELSGYDKFVYDSFPKHKGFLNFSGTLKFENPVGGFAALLGTYIDVKDIAGTLVPTLSKDQTGQTMIGPGLNSISFDFHLFLPSQSNENQVILQKNASTLGNRYGLTVGILSSSASDTTASLIFTANSGSTGLLATTGIEKGSFTRVVASLDRNESPPRLKLFKNSILSATSSNGLVFGSFGISGNSLIIGSGSAILTGSDASAGLVASRQFIPAQTFSGSLDELRIFHDVPSIKMQSENQLDSIFSGKNLRAYFKFNEPTGSYSNNDIVLDASGNSLHSRISNFVLALRNTGSMTVPLTNERLDQCPVLFPAYPDLTTLNMKLLNSASQYDANNPNLITKLIPSHYFSEAKFFEGFANDEGLIGQLFETANQDFPGAGKVPGVQLVTLLLLMYARFFDELKMYIDHFSRLLKVDYIKDKRIADQFLTFLGEYYGFTLPNFYSSANIKQYLEGKNLLADPTYAKFSLHFVQNELWRRMLANLRDVINSKGTVHSVKAVIRSIGLNPDKNFRIREFGGARKREIGDARKNLVDVSALLDFSGSRASVASPGAVNAQGIHPNRPFVFSPFLSGSRFSIGLPTAQGPFTKNDHLISINHPHGISSNPDDGLFTSGSFTYEGLYKFTNLIPPVNSELAHQLTQSLCRINVTGSATSHGLIFNLLALSESLSLNRTGSLILYGRPGTVAASPTLRMVLTGVNIFDGKDWYVSFGRQYRESLPSLASSSYFLRAGTQNHGSIARYHATSTFFREFNTLPNNQVLGQVTPAYNTSGSFLVMGSQSLGTGWGGATGDAYLNYVGALSNQPQATESLSTKFDGKISRIRFWSKFITPVESYEHIRNFNSVGVQNPFTHYNFVTSETGSFARLRLDSWCRQAVTQSDALGEISIFDYSQVFSSGTRGAPWNPSSHQNKMEFALSGTGFEVSKKIIKPIRIDYSLIDPKYDERSEDNKIRIRSFEKTKNVQLHGGVMAPHYEVNPSERPNDDTRFIIESSFVQALNEDIINIFGTLEVLDSVLGNPELLFAETYPDLKVLRDVYFNRLTGKINIKEFFEFIKWFDDAMTMIIEKLLPRKTDFLGIQFVVESHILERHKFRYDYAQNYIRVLDRLVIGVDGGDSSYASLHAVSKPFPIVNKDSRESLPDPPDNYEGNATDGDRNG